MNPIQKTILQASRQVIGNNWFPGRYYLSETLIDLLGGRNQVVVGDVGEYSLNFNFQDLLQRQMWFKLYDIHEIQLVREILKEGDIFFDVGANIGYYSFIASQQVKSTGLVHAFEPISRNIRAITDGIETNAISNIAVNQLAISDTEGKLTIFQADKDIGNSGWASIIQTKLKHHPIEVTVTTLDSYVQKHNIAKIDLIKMDIEGAEFEAIKGMKTILTGSHKPSIILELNEFLLKQRALPSRDILTYLKQYGYRFYVISRKLTETHVDLKVKGVVNILCTAK
jgi:FkbM family methyltransferase